MKEKGEKTPLRRLLEGVRQGGRPRRKAGGGGRPVQGEGGPGGSWEGCLGHHTWREVKPRLPQAGRALRARDHGKREAQSRAPAGSAPRPRQAPQGKGSSHLGVFCSVPSSP